MEKYGFLEMKMVEVFEYRKNNNRYWNGVKLYKQVVSKALPIAEALYLRYSLLFLFDHIGKLFSVDQGALGRSDSPISQIACPYAQA